MTLHPCTHGARSPANHEGEGRGGNLPPQSPQYSACSRFAKPQAGQSLGLMSKNAAKARPPDRFDEYHGPFFYPAGPP